MTKDSDNCRGPDSTPQSTMTIDMSEELPGLIDEPVLEAPIMTYPIWKARGDELCRAGRFYHAIRCYDAALKTIRTQSEIQAPLVNRCYARLMSEHYDAAIQDAKAILRMVPHHEKSLYRWGRAAYGLGNYKESYEIFSKTFTLYPQNLAARKELQKCQRRLQEQDGSYDFAAMLDEAVSKSPEPTMDRANYVGPIDVRVTTDESRGRGVFTTRDVQAGEVLLVEKAFKAAFQNQDGNKTAAQLRADLSTGTYVKLYRNPSLQPLFRDLYPGPSVVADIDDKHHETAIDDAFVQLRIMYNSFAFPILSKDWHWRATQMGVAENQYNSNTCSGTWIKASYINHACYCNIRRSFIGDMMIWRASADIPANTELTLSYIAAYEDHTERQQLLSPWGFECDCSLCVHDRNASQKTRDERASYITSIFNKVELEKPSDIMFHFEMLDKICSTYNSKPSEEPRRDLVIPIVNLLVVCGRRDMHHAIVRLGIVLLTGLGFEIQASPSKWNVERWGFMCDDVLTVLCDVWLASSYLDPDVCPDIETVLRTAYVIMCGEDASFEAAYGHLRPQRREAR